MEDSTAMKLEAFLITAMSDQTDWALGWTRMLNGALSNVPEEFDPATQTLKAADMFPKLSTLKLDAPESLQYMLGELSSNIKSEETILG